MNTTDAFDASGGTYSDFIERVATTDWKELQSIDDIDDRMYDEITNN